MTDPRAASQTCTGNVQTCPIHNFQVSCDEMTLRNARAASQRVEAPPQWMQDLKDYLEGFCDHMDTLHGKPFGWHWDILKASQFSESEVAQPASSPTPEETRIVRFEQLMYARGWRIEKESQTDRYIDRYVQTAWLVFVAGCKFGNDERTAENESSPSTSASNLVIHL